MHTFIKIAWRNIVRNKYRSLITVMAVSFGLAALIFIRAFVDGGDCQMIENYTDLVSAHLQIHIKDFHKKMGLERSIVQPDQTSQILKDFPEVTSFSKRIKEYVLLSSAEHSSGILLIGIEPSKEKEITSLHKRIRRGEFLAEGKDGQIVIGKDLGEILEVDIEDKVVVMAQGSDGSLSSGAYRVCGILDTGAEELDKGIALINLKDAQELLVLGERVSEFAIRSESVYKVDMLAKRLKERIDTDKFEVLTWKEISPMVSQWLEFDRAFVNVILVVVLLVVAAGILNTLLMGVLERIREFGIMLALGTKRRQIVQMVALESLFLGLIGIIFGLILGSGISIYFGKQGINLSKFSTALESYYTGSIIYPRIFLGYIAVFTLAVLLVSIIASVYPAWRAARLKPVEAIRYL